MLDQLIRASILTLREAGHGTRAIARALHISRNAVKAVLADGRGTAADPEVREGRALPRRDLGAGGAVQGQPRAGSRGTARAGQSSAVVSGADGLLSTTRHRAASAPAVWPLLVQARRCSTTHRPIERTSAGPSAACRPPRWCSVTPACCSSSAIRGQGALWQGSASTSEPGARAECGSPARSDLCGGLPEPRGEGPSLPQAVLCERAQQCSAVAIQGRGRTAHSGSIRAADRTDQGLPSSEPSGGNEEPRFGAFGQQVGNEAAETRATEA